jgi:hypothetical protein
MSAVLADQPNLLPPLSQPNLSQPNLSQPNLSQGNLTGRRLFTSAVRRTG